jgi:hypothetical protein
LEPVGLALHALKTACATERSRLFATNFGASDLPSGLVAALWPL